MIGFETIGNATVTVFDDEPVLSTDPWINGKPYFGSWGHSHSIPQQQIDNVINSKFIWLSHGHPDHIDRDSYVHFTGSTILIPDHYGDRIYDYFNANYDCIKIKSNEWFQVSKNVRIKSFADWNQDAALLVDILGKDLLVNVNDGGLLGWSSTVKKITKGYKNKFLLQLHNWGDADMINLYDEGGSFILPNAASQPQVGKYYTRKMKNLNCNYAIPFSAFHKFVREDSVHMNQFSTPLEKHGEGYDDKYGELLPAFISWDSTSDDYKQIKVEEVKNIILTPEECGDNYSDQLTDEDKQKITSYFHAFGSLPMHFGSIVFTVGGEDFGVKLSDHKAGLKFELARGSLMKAINWEIFDDLLIGNFMKTTLINCTSLYPNFTPVVAKYADNGLAKSKKELNEYFDYYKLNSADYWRDMCKFKTEGIVRSFISPQSKAYEIGKAVKQKLF
ncbi:MBL fold metallo-hydrolase [bacterium]|nr:MBL fold metallo-hydrolase [bacterium]